MAQGMFQSTLLMAPDYICCVLIVIKMENQGEREMTTIRCSKSVRAQLITMEMVNSAIVSFKTPINEMAEESQTVIKSIKKRLNSIKNHLSNNGKYGLSKSQAKSFKGSIEQIKQILDSSLDEFSGLDYLNAILALVEDIAGVSKRFVNKALAYDWERLNSLLAELYSHDDPEIEQDADIEKGLKMARQIRGVMEV